MGKTDSGKGIKKKQSMCPDFRQNKNETHRRVPFGRQNYEHNSAFLVNTKALLAVAVTVCQGWSKSDCRASATTAGFEFIQSLV